MDFEYLDNYKHKSEYCKECGDRLTSDDIKEEDDLCESCRNILK